MLITKQTVAEQIAAYLHHEITLPQLVDWAENVMLDGEFGNEDAPVLRDVMAHLGVADVKAFGLTWEDCESLLNRLGYTAHVEVMAG
ncbi:MAG TPA: hypothetical protein PLG59_11960 [bacterium]|nr:hypothetical protein [bacterium]HQO35371.1 hypothetical protein [bacterium]HQP97541.1 hypothetical protein [bacterium]